MRTAIERPKHQSAEGCLTMLSPTLPQNSASKMHTRKIPDAHFWLVIWPPSLTSYSYISCSFPSSLCLLSKIKKMVNKSTAKTKAIQCSHHSFVGWLSFGPPGLLQQHQMMENATAKMETKLSTFHLATRKLKLHLAVIAITVIAVSVMGSASQVPTKPPHLTLQAHARTSRGIHPWYAPKFVIKTKPGKFILWSHSWAVQSPRLYPPKAMLIFCFLLVCLTLKNLHYMHPAKSANIDPTFGNGVQPCHDGTYCCYNLSDAECCYNHSLLFTLGSGPATIKTSFGPEMTTSKSSTTSSTTATTKGLVFSSADSLVSTSSAPSTSSSRGPISANTTDPTPSSVPQRSSNHVAIGVGIGVGVPVGIALFSGLAYLIRRRQSKTSNGRDRIETRLVNRKDLDLDLNQNVTARETFEALGNGMPTELPEQGLVEFAARRWIFWNWDRIKGYAENIAVN